MSNPINIDLNVKSSNINPLSPSKNNIKNILKFINNQKNHSVYSDDYEHVFTFPKNKNKIMYREKYENQTCFLNNGSNSVVFVIETSDHEYKILKISSDEFDVKKYKKVKLLFQNAIPNIYLYGTIYNEHYNVSYEYVITDIIHTDFENILIEFKFLYLKKLTTLLINFHENNYILNDLKMSNLGYDEKYNVIIIDYETFTVFHYDDDITNLNFTFLPYYAFDFYDKQNRDIKRFYSKIEILGWLDVLIKLFFNRYYFRYDGVARKIGLDFFFLNFECVLYKTEEDCKKNTNPFCDTSLEEYDVIPTYYDVCNVNLKNKIYSNIFMKNLTPLHDNDKIYNILKNVLNHKNMFDLKYENIPSFIEIIHLLNYEGV